MPRGVVPRQPARTGRQDKVRAARTPVSMKSAPKREAKRAALPGAKAKKAKSGGAKGYNPTAPERVTEILKRLNDLYPDVTCALTHASAWELLLQRFFRRSRRTSM